jgi:hypothetical protein
MNAPRHVHDCAVMVWLHLPGHPSPECPPCTCTLRRVPALLTSLTVWAVDCTKCGEQIRLGRGSKPAIMRLLATGPALCGACRGGSA